MRCATCAGPLLAQGGRHGLVWVCGDCVAGATTLGVLRHVAPRAFINHLWQAARLHGTPSRKACPSCTQPLVELRPPRVQIEPPLDVCCRCFLIWMERATLLKLSAERPRGAPLALAAGEIADALELPRQC
jgi:Zn-finger nucleic acid-binding protein